MTKKTKPIPEQVIVIVRAARLDNGVYQGIDELPEDQLTADHLPQITECDLPPGKYRWDGRAFVPLPKLPPERAVKEPDTLKAIAKGFMAVERSGITLPVETRNWLDWYTGTIDSKG